MLTPSRLEAETEEQTLDPPSSSQMSEGEKRNLRKRLCRFYVSLVLHLVIPAYGLAILTFQILPSWRLEHTGAKEDDFIPPIVRVVD